MKKDTISRIKWKRKDKQKIIKMKRNLGQF